MSLTADAMQKVDADFSAGGPMPTDLLAELNEVPGAAEVRAANFDLQVKINAERARLDSIDPRSTPAERRQLQEEVAGSVAQLEAGLMLMNPCLRRFHLVRWVPRARALYERANPKVFAMKHEYATAAARGTLSATEGAMLARCDDWLSWVRELNLAINRSETELAELLPAEFKARRAAVQAAVAAMTPLKNELLGQQITDAAARIHAELADQAAALAEAEKSGSWEDLERLSSPEHHQKALPAPPRKRAAAAAR